MYYLLPCSYTENGFGLSPVIHFIDHQSKLYYKHLKSDLGCTIQC